MVDITNIDSKIASIPSNFIMILDYLKKAEGNILEKNRGESDITAPLGIYRKEHPNAQVFEYIDSVAKKVTSTQSYTWDDVTIKKIDILLDKKVCYYLAYLYYADFYKSASLEYFDTEVVLVIVSLFANSPLLCNKAVQMSVNIMGLSDYIDIDTGTSIVVDGAVGKGTKAELKEIDELSADVNYAFRLLILSNAKTLYLNLYLSNTNKFGTFIKGWFNRCDALHVKERN